MEYSLCSPIKNVNFVETPLKHFIFMDETSSFKPLKHHKYARKIEG